MATLYHQIYRRLECTFNLQYSALLSKVLELDQLRLNLLLFHRVESMSLIDKFMPATYADHRKMLSSYLRQYDLKLLS